MDKNGPGGTEIKKALRAFISSSTLPLARVASFTDEDSFLEKGILDSTGVLELVGHIENEYQIRFEADEIIPDNLDSIDKIADFVARKTGILFHGHEKAEPTRIRMLSWFRQNKAAVSLPIVTPRSDFPGRAFLGAALGLA